MPNLDQFFLLNASLDALLLWGIGRVRSRALGWRLPVGALLGAAYATAALLPGLRVLGGPLGEVGAGTLMVLVASRSWNARRLAADTGALLLLAAGLAGLVLLVAGVAHPRGTAGSLAVLAAGGALFVALVERFRRWKLSGGSAREILPVSIELAGTRLELPALVDTGCQARDPLTGLPVLIAELAAVRRALPEALGRALAEAFPAAAEVAAAAAEDDRLARSLRLIELRTVGSQGEWLFGLRASARIAGRPPQATVVCLTPRRLSPTGDFAALLPPQMCAFGEGLSS